MRIKWREFWRLEGLELVGRKYLNWVRVLKKQEKNRKRIGRVREKVGECWSFVENLGSGCWSRTAGVVGVELVL